MKKIIALVLALVMILSLGTVASARAVKEEAIVFVTDTVAHSLQWPANVLANVLLWNQDNIVDGVNTVLPVAYYGVQNSALLLDSAVQLGAKAAEARIFIASRAAMLATGIVSNILEDVAENASGAAQENLFNLASETDALGGMIYAGAEEALDAIDGITDVADEVLAGLNRVKINNIISFIKYGTKRAPGFTAQVKNFGDLTIKQFVVPGAWKELFLSGAELNKGLGLTVADLIGEDQSVAAFYTDLAIGKVAEVLKNPELYADADFTDGVSGISEFLFNLIVKEK